MAQAQRGKSDYEYRIVLQTRDSVIQRLDHQGSDLAGCRDRLRALLNDGEHGYYWNGWIERRPLGAWEAFEKAMVPQ